MDIAAEDDRPSEW